MVALQHAHFGDIGEAQDAVRGCVVELSSIQQSTVHSRHDLAAWQGIHCSAHGGEQVNGQTVGTEFQAFEVFWFGDGLLEPAQRLGRHRTVQERLDVGADGCIQFGQQLLAAAVFVPGQQHVGVHAECGARIPQCQCVLLTVVVAQHAMAAVQGSLGHSFQQTECWHDRARWEHFNLEFAAGHVIDELGEIQCVFMEDVLGGPSALPTHGDRSGLRLGQHGCRERTGCNCTLQHSTTRRGFDLVH